jgi:mannose-1-phosphate guanylyltransferase
MVVQRIGDWNAIRTAVVHIIKGAGPLTNFNLEQIHRWAVVLAGGDGTRLQPLTQLISGDCRPKQFCPLFGERSLLGHTRDRIAPIIPGDQTLFVLSRTHELYYRTDLEDVPGSQRLIQPANRGTAVAMALCLLTILERDEDAVVTFFPSDHHYANSAAFRASIESGIRAMNGHPHSVLLLGAHAHNPEVEYGWIEPGEAAMGSRDYPLYQVSRFWEKPALLQAKALQRRGCLWNSFVTIGRASAFLELLDSSIPALLPLLRGYTTISGQDELFHSLPSFDFSRDVLTHQPHRLMVLRDSDSGWTDFGSPRRVLDVLMQGGTRPSWFRAHHQSAFQHMLQAVS